MASSTPVPKNMQPRHRALTCTPASPSETVRIPASSRRDDRSASAVERDLDGEPLPRASRTPVCKATGETYGFAGQLDGAWYRCCGGQVRKLVDCCGYVHHRINGDAALTGYCFQGRKVFCVMYYDTHVPC